MSSRVNFYNLWMLFVIFSSFNISIAQAQTVPMPIDRLESILAETYRYNPTIRAARLEFHAVEEKLPQARSNWFPSLSADANITRNNYDGDMYSMDGLTTKGVGADIVQPLYRGGRTMAQQGSAESLISGQKMLLEAQVQDTMLDVVTSYMNISRDQSILDLRENNFKLISELLTASRQRFDAGAVTKTDVAQSESRLARAEADRARATGDLSRSKGEFERVAGMMVNNPGVPSLRFQIPDTLDKAMQIADQNNPEIVASDYFHKASKKDIELVFGEQLPDIGAFASWDHEFDPYPGSLGDSTISAIGVRARIDLYKGGAMQSRAREARHTANRRFLQIMESKRRIRQEVISNWANLKSAQAEIRSREVQVEAASSAREGVKKEEELGTRTVLDTLDAEQEYLDARTGLAIARRNEIVATFSLAASLGLLTPEILGFSRIEGEAIPDYDRYSAARTEKTGD